VLQSQVSKMRYKNDREMGEMSDADSTLQKGERAAKVSTWVTAALALGKGVGGLLTGSVVLISDAVHSAIDVLPVTASWLGLKVSRRKPDERFPYGYFKAESVATLFISLFIILAAVELVIEGYSRLFEMSEASQPLVAAGVSLISAMTSALLARYQRRVGEEICSQSLITNARDTLMDVVVSLLVVAAIVLAFYEVPYVEGLAIISISVFILKIGLESIKDSVFALMDISPDREVEGKVVRTIGSVAGVEGFADLKLRRSGPFLLGEVTVKVRKQLDVERAHQISARLEEELRRNVKPLEAIVVHIEPCEVHETRVVVPLKNDAGMASVPSQRFGRANYFAMASLNRDEGKVEDLVIMTNPEREREARAGLHAVKILVQEKVDALITNDIGEIAFHALRDHLISIYLMEGGRLDEVLQNFMEGKLDAAFEPTKKDMD